MDIKVIKQISSTSWVPFTAAAMIKCNSAQSETELAMDITPD